MTPVAWELSAVANARQDARHRSTWAAYCATFDLYLDIYLRVD